MRLSRSSGSWPRPSGGSAWKVLPRPNASPLKTGIGKAVRVSVLHHENHASGIIVLAALYNALKVVGKSLQGSAHGD